MSNDHIQEEGKVYEFAYLFVPTIEEELLAPEISALKEEVVSLGATFISEEYPRLINLAYEMARTIANKKQKFDSAYFGWMKFELDPEKISLLKEMMDRKETIIRSMIVKTVKENTVSSKKSVSRDIKGKGQPKEDISAEGGAEIDKKIEELVVSA